MKIQDEVATTCTVASLLISGYQIVHHLSNYSEPHLQLYIIRILMMIPVSLMHILIRKKDYYKLLVSTGYSRLEMAY